jgi:hypothetical protein
MDLFVAGKKKGGPTTTTELPFHAEVSSGYSESTGLASEIFKLLCSRSAGRFPSRRLIDWSVLNFRLFKFLGEARVRISRISRMYCTLLPQDYRQCLVSTFHLPVSVTMLDCRMARQESGDGRGMDAPPLSSKSSSSSRQ